jgi:hypothetical protein
VEVVVGKENMIFESGPFTYFGTQALIQNIGVGKFGVIEVIAVLFLYFVFYFIFYCNSVLLLIGAN